MSMSAERARRLVGVVALINVVACDGVSTPTEVTSESGGPLASKAEQGLVSGGAAAVRRASVRVERGVGIVATGVGTLSIERVALAGVVTRSTASSLPPLPSPDETSTHGLFLLDIGHLSIDGVAIRGFGRVGALVAHSESEWDDVRVVGNAEVGLAVVGGTARLEDVRVHRTWAGGLSAGPRGWIAAGLGATPQGGLSGRMGANLDVARWNVGVRLTANSAGRKVSMPVHSAASAMSSTTPVS